ncbi:MAG TPA: GAF domain-containing protein [Terriglobales bacterium]|jgi:signal transduction protein with GAF and PtsI domain|nr:GAF domain-containing protein [Terriglobales bacterium]
MFASSVEDSQVNVLHHTVTRIASADGFHQALDRVLDFAVGLVKCDSCFIYVLAGEDLVLRASKNPHQELLDRLKLRMGQGITGWVAEHREPVAVSREAYKDPRFQRFNELPEDRYEAFLSVPLFSRGRLVGVLSLQHRDPHIYTESEIHLLRTVGSLAGAEIELARLETQNSELSQQLRTRKIVERAKGILQRDLGLTEEQAYLSIQRQSRQKRKTMKEIAEAILLSEEVKSASKAD